MAIARRGKERKTVWEHLQFRLLFITVFAWFLGAGGDKADQVGATARAELLARGQTRCKQRGALRVYENLKSVAPDSCNPEVVNEVIPTESLKKRSAWRSDGRLMQCR